MHRTLIAAAALVSLTTAPESPLDIATRSLARIDGVQQLAGLRAEVTVVRDTWGVPHIRARSVDDLFFAQGYVMAQDRLWQMEMWRRANEGRLAEVIGPQAVARDTRARLLKYRGPFDDAEWSSYHPDGKRIFGAFAAGVNAFIAEHRERLPVEFVLTGVTPDPWTPETVVLRTPTFGDAPSELRLARSVARLGVKRANAESNPDPWDELVVPEGLDVAAVDDAVIASVAGQAAAPPLAPAILPRYRSLAARRGRGAAFDAPSGPVGDPGSNNWVVSAARSATGRPVVANDPHREVMLPSLRYIVHLEAPGWNVIGAAEPPFIGVALGHNAQLAWGLTIVGTDQHDVYVEETNPARPGDVRWNDRWEPMRVVHEEIKVKGDRPVTVDLKFTRHGPVFHEDTRRHLAYALRSALLEPGTAPYLAGLRLSQSRTCRDFLDAAMYWKSPSENLICGDVDGTIAWRPAALTPARAGWTGRLPVPGTGRYEWRGFRADLPFELNPARGFIATANNNINPPGYTPPLMFKNADTRFDRITRLLQMISRPQPLTFEDHQRMQHDAHSLRAAADLPLFRGWTAADAGVERARAAIAAWDGVYSKESQAAALYDAWRGRTGRGADPSAAAPSAPPPRDVVESRLRAAIDRLTRELGGDWREWRWGRLHTRAFPHPFVRELDLPTVERSGGAGTVAADGATYREILDVGDWDRSLAVNVPGQSGQPGSPYYANLLPLWADNQYFPLAFTSTAVDAAAAHRLRLEPKEK